MCERYINQLPLTRPQLGTWSATQARALTGDQNGSLLVRRPALNSLSHTIQGGMRTFVFFFKSSPKDMIIDFRERGREVWREGWREKGRETSM